MTRPLFDAVQDDEIAELYLGGKSMLELSQAFGCSITAIRTSLRRSGIERRSRSAQAAASAGTLREALQANVVIDAAGCWVWHGALVHGKYPTLSYHGEQFYAYRAAYTEYIGPLPDGLDIGTTCGNRKCINPRHLVARTREGSMAHTIGTKRPLHHTRRGEAHAQARLSDADVIAIQSSKEPRDVLAARHHISVGYVSRLRARRSRRSALGVLVQKGGLV